MKRRPWLWLGASYSGQAGAEGRQGSEDDFAFVTAVGVGRLTWEEEAEYNVRKDPFDILGSVSECLRWRSRRGEQTAK